MEQNINAVEETTVDAVEEVVAKSNNLAVKVVGGVIVTALVVGGAVFGIKKYKAKKDDEAVAEAEAEFVEDETEDEAEDEE